eukprot:symbB.v1.2.038299.t1/scaffold5854.1/size23084/1
MNCFEWLFGNRRPTRRSFYVDDLDPAIPPWTFVREVGKRQPGRNNMSCEKAPVRRGET